MGRKPKTKRRKYQLDYGHPANRDLRFYRFLAVSDAEAIEKVVVFISRTKVTEGKQVLHARPWTLIADTVHRQIDLPWERIDGSSLTGKILPFPQTERGSSTLNLLKARWGE